MEDVLKKYEMGGISPIEVENSMEFHAQALENISSKEINAIRELTYQLVIGHMSDEYEEYCDAPAIEDILKRFRDLLNNLPK